MFTKTSNYQTSENDCSRDTHDYHDDTVPQNNDDTEDDPDEDTNHDTDGDWRCNVFSTKTMMALGSRIKGKCSRLKADWLKAGRGSRATV